MSGNHNVLTFEMKNALLIDFNHGYGCSIVLLLTKSHVWFREYTDQFATHREYTPNEDSFCEKLRIVENVLDEQRPENGSGSRGKSNQTYTTHVRKTNGRLFTFLQKCYLVTTNLSGFTTSRKFSFGLLNFEAFNTQGFRAFPFEDSIVTIPVNNGHISIQEMKNPFETDSSIIKIDTFTQTDARTNHSNSSFSVNGFGKNFQKNEVFYQTDVIPVIPYHFPDDKKHITKYDENEDDDECLWECPQEFEEISIEEMLIEILGDNKKGWDIIEMFKRDSKIECDAKKEFSGKKMKRKRVDDETSHQFPSKKRKISRKDTSLTSSEIFCIKLKIPLVLNVSTGILFDKYQKNQHYFSEHKEELVGQYLGRWFGVYHENSKPIVVCGRSRRNVMNKCPAGSIITFGTVQDHVFVRKSVKYFKSFGSHSVPSNTVDDKYRELAAVFSSENHYYVDCELSFLKDDGTRTEPVKTIAVIDSGSDDLSMSTKCIPSGDLVYEGEDETKCYDVILKLFGDDGEKPLEKHCKISLIGSTHEKANDQGIVLLGNEGFLFDMNYFQTFVDDVPTFNLLREGEEQTIIFKDEE